MAKEPELLSLASFCTKYIYQILKTNLEGQLPSNITRLVSRSRGHSSIKYITFI